MATYILRRLVVALPILLGISLLVFGFVAIAPGDPATAYLKPELANNPEVRAILAKQLGLDQPLPVRYLAWLSQTLQGNLGYSTLNGLPVSQLVGRAMTASLMLLGTALVIGIAVGIPLGVVSAVHPGSRLDVALTIFTFVGISTPSFMLAIGGLFLFGLVLDIFPTGGMNTPAKPFDLWDFLAHLALPALVLSIAYVATLARYTRASMLDVLRSEYITTAAAKGLPGRIVLGRHAFRNALIPIVTIIGLSLPDLVGGAVITETVFTWPGMGSLMVTAVAGRDFPIIMGVSLVIAIAILLANLLTDVAYAFADPRIRY